MLFKFISVCTFLSTTVQDDCKRRTLFLFSEALKVFISSSVRRVGGKEGEGVGGGGSEGFARTPFAGQ